MHYYLHYNIIYYNLVARNCCRGARRKFSTIRAKAVESVPKVHSTLLLRTRHLSRNPTLWQMASGHGFRLRTKRNGSTREK